MQKASKFIGIFLAGILFLTFILFITTVISATIFWSVIAITFLYTQRIKIINAIKKIKKD